jgi:hypothetical protein
MTRLMGSDDLVSQLVSIHARAGTLAKLAELAMYYGEGRDGTMVAGEGYWDATKCASLRLVSGSRDCE